MIVSSRGGARYYNSDLIYYDLKIRNKAITYQSNIAL